MQPHLKDQIGDDGDNKTHQDRKQPLLFLDDTQKKEEKKQGDDQKTQPFHKQAVEEEREQNKKDLGHIPLSKDRSFCFLVRTFSERSQYNGQWQEGDDDTRPEENKAQP